MTDVFADEVGYLNRCQQTLGEYVCHHEQEEVSRRHVVVVHIIVSSCFFRRLHPSTHPALDVALPDNACPPSNLI